MPLRCGKTDKRIEVLFGVEIRGETIHSAFDGGLDLPTATGFDVVFAKLPWLFI